MKIASADIEMSSGRVFTQQDSTKERLNAWTRKRPDTPRRNIEDHAALGTNALSSHPEPRVSHYESCSPCKRSQDEDDELSAKDGHLFVLKRLIEEMTGRKMRLRRLDLNRSPDGHPNPGPPPETLERAQQARQGQQGWGVEYERTSTHYESEQTVFAAEGTIITSYGREIGLSLNLTMSRELMTTETESFRAGDAVRKVDPLVLNFEGNAVELTDAQFAFDLDQDGQQESISFVGSGSGILVLDRNRDGIVNDGGELFGPSTGNGFSELASFDEDQNGWIDENDAVYRDLSVWTRTEAGEDALVTFQTKQIGAIYLGNVLSPFDIKTGTTLKGQVIRTGVFIDEDGGTGTIQQVDLVT